jgi:SAM-dependent methyltransferase
MPEIYDEELGPALFAPYAAEVGARVAALRPRRVLELAAGTGLLTRELVARLPEAEVTATDLNEVMVRAGRARVPGATWRRADAQQLTDEPDGGYDVVVCQFGAMFFPDRVRAYAEARRVLAEQGRLVLAVWDVLAGSSLTTAFVQALAEVLPDRTPDFLARVPHGYADPQQVRRDLEAAGLAVETAERVELQGTASSALGLARGFCLGTPLRSELAGRGEVASLTAQVAEHLRARLGPGPLVGELSAWLFVAR